MSYAIQWNLLLDDERDFLESIGVELLPSGMRFTRRPTWEDFCLTFAYIFGVRNRTLQEGNHIYFAIGDCILAGQEYFGKEAVGRWMRSFLRLVSMRDHLLGLAGATLIALQMVEEQIKLCCTLVRPKSLKLTLDDFLSPDPSRRKQTLGQLTSALKKSAIFDPTFEDRLTAFVSNRNKFVHNLWAEQARQSKKESGLPSEDEMKAIHDFLVLLLRETQYVLRVFLGCQYAIEKQPIVAALGEPESLVSTQWTRYIPEFEKVLRER